jgi:hypothetical protein
MTVLAFEYFQAPPEHMDELCEGEHVCSLCGQTGICFYLDFAICKELENMEKEGKLVVCQGSYS